MAAAMPFVQERIYNALKADYLAGIFTPGRRLDIQEIADRHSAFGSEQSALAARQSSFAGGRYSKLPCTPWKPCFACFNSHRITRPSL